MKRLAILALAGVISCAALLPAVPSRASSLYPIVVEMKGEGATITVYSPTDRSIRMTFYVPANATKSYALENAAYYEFRMTICGKTHTSRWNRVGAGVTVTVHGCDGFSFTMRR